MGAKTSDIANNHVYVCAILIINNFAAIGQMQSEKQVIYICMMLALETSDDCHELLRLAWKNWRFRHIFASTRGGYQATNSIDTTTFLRAQKAAGHVYYMYKYIYIINMRQLVSCRLLSTQK